MASPQSPSIIGSKIGDGEIINLLAQLRPHLPHCLPLYRRLQFHLTHPNPPHAHAFLALDVARGSKERINGARPINGFPASDVGVDPQAWLAAHIDLSRSGRTQIWVYGSWERDSPSPSDPDNSKHDPACALPSAAILPLTTRKLFFTTLFKYVAELIPSLPITPPAEWLELERTGKYLSKPYSRSKVLFGSFSTCNWPCLPHESPGIVSRVDRWYSKFIFTPPATSLPSEATTTTSLQPAHDQTVVDRRCSKEDTRFASTTALGPAFRFAALQQAHLQTVLDRTPIPRTLSSLSQLPSIGLFHASHPNPIGWGFLGQDASLSSLHTEPEFRGQGLAVSLSQKLFEIQRQHGGVFGLGDDEGYAHADVSESNTGSLRVMEKLGGKAMWKVCWVELDLDKIFESRRNGK
jgi:GNAT superfamily N-acetyltransferase